MNDELSKTEIGKDALQNVVEAAATTVGQVTTILSTAVKDVASVLGGFATEVFAIRDAARRAAADADDADRATDTVTDAATDTATDTDTDD